MKSQCSQSTLKLQCWRRLIERLRRSLKYGLIYPCDFATGLDLHPALDNYFHFYTTIVHTKRPQTSGARSA